MASNSSISSSNRRFVLAAVVGLAAILAVDHWLYAERGFLRTFGPGTQEGQVLGKLDAAPRAARVADIVLFGSSYTRSGVSTRPFQDQGLIVLNLGISGAGPLFAYEALRQIAPVIAKREVRPTLVLEISPSSLEAGANWDEYPQWVSAIRSRTDVVRSYLSYYSYFAENGQASRLFNSLLLPSAYYRSSRRYVLLGGRYDAGFFGDEDVGGFAAISTAKAPGLIPDGVQSYHRTLSAYSPQKLEYVRRFLALAQQLGTPVVLYFYPLHYQSPERAAVLSDYLKSQFPASNLDVMTNADVGVELADLDFGSGHLNLRGSDKAARALIHKLHVNRDAASAHALWASLATEHPLETATAGAGIRESRSGCRGMALDFDGTAGVGAAWYSKEISVKPGSRHTMDVSYSFGQGNVVGAIEILDDAGTLSNSVSSVWPLMTDGALPAGEQSLAITPTAAHAQVRVAVRNAPAKGTVCLRLLWSR
jgi:hypothetical protein